MKNQNLVVYDERTIASYIDGNYDYFIAGSDQIWNPDFAGNDFYFLGFAKPQKRIVFAASIGYETLPEKVLERYTKFWKEMKYSSVREDSAADFIEKATGKQPDVFLDPTMLLTADEWRAVSKRPDFEFPSKYILCLFLGDIPEAVTELQTKNDIPLIFLDDKSYPKYYFADPSEFLYLVEHAELVLTDSFHCTVFSAIFHKQFRVFERKDASHKSMFTRLENLLGKLDFRDRVQGRDKIVPKEDITDKRFEKADAMVRQEYDRVNWIFAGIL